MNSHAKVSRIKLLTVLIVISLLAACSKDSVVSNNTGQQNAATSASPTPADANNSAASPQPGASIPNASGTPATTPTSPVGPVGQTTPTSPLDAQPGEKKQMMGNLPVTVGPAKPALTPAPDPFPPRPTPTVVVQSGKVVQQWQAPAEAASMTNPVKDRPDAVKIGREFYMQKCVDCHGKEGKGNGYMSKMVAKPPTNLASQMVQANSDGELFWKVTNGKSPMPAHRVRFDDEQRWYIVTYLRTFKP
jgi:mono/diheme cytochrome c family protein